MTVTFSLTSVHTFALQCFVCRFPGDRSSIPGLLAGGGSLCGSSEDVFQDPGQEEGLVGGGDLQVCQNWAAQGALTTGVG